MYRPKKNFKKFDTPTTHPTYKEGTNSTGNIVDKNNSLNTVHFHYRSLKTKIIYYFLIKFTRQWSSGLASNLMK